SMAFFRNSDKEPNIELFIKAGHDGENVGNCPFCQRLFMVLWLKGVKFTVTTVDMRKKPAELKDLSPGTNPPFLLYNVTLKIILHQNLLSPLSLSFPPHSIAPLTWRADIFAKFSAFIKNSPNNAVQEKNLLREFKRLDDYLNSPLPEEIDHTSDETITVSKRKFLDGDRLTLADCNLLPKLQVIRVAAKKYCNFEIPADFTGVWRYLENADEREEFKQTCPADVEIEKAYFGVANNRK
uniref:Chloride intracellular channel protein n=1 Tax=Tetraodon nigroviridis TaxID=99883 RepID=H3DEA4_TETNG